MTALFDATAEGVERALRALGDTPDAVAATLQALGCVGERGARHHRTCPVAVYVRTCCAPPRDSAGRDVSVAHDVLLDVTDVHVPLPAAVAEFIAEFDISRSRYPELVEAV